MKLKLPLFLTIALLVTPSLQASDHHHHPPKEGIPQLIHIFHEAIAGEHKHFHSPKDFFVALTKLETAKEVIEQLNFKKIFLRTNRIYNLQQNKQKLQEHVKNLAFILPASHLLEISLSPHLRQPGSIE